MRRARRATAVWASALLLAGCGLLDRKDPDRDCPRTGVISSANRVVKFAGPGRDLTDILFEVEILDATGTCSYRRGQVTGDTTVQFLATAGPALRDRRGAVPYFVAIVDPAGGIAAKQEFSLTLTFEAGQPALQLADELRQTIPINTGGNLAGYQVLVGFQLSADELTYNRSLIGR